MIRRARPDDVEFLVDLYAEPDVRPFLAGGHDVGPEAVAAEVERSERDPDLCGTFVIEVEGERAGAMSFERTNERSRIAHLGRLAVHPRFRGRRVADEAARELVRHLLLDAGFHRLELEVYGFNTRAIGHAERAGFLREGVKRKAYRRGDGWVDGLLYAVVREDLDRD